MDCCEFEPKIQVDCALKIVSIVRGGDLLSAKAELLQHSGCFLGCLGAKLVDDEHPVFGSVEQDCEVPCDIEGCSDQIEQLCQETEPPTFGSPLLSCVAAQLVQLILAKLLEE